jgi:drug/metabolite transporter (DMT)-like permease
MPTRATRLLAFAAVYLVWGTTYLGIRIAVADMPPILMAGFRFLTAGAALHLFLRLRGAPQPTFAQWKGQALIGLGLVGGNAIVCWAEQRVASDLSALAVGVAPIFTVLIAWAMPDGTRPNRLVCAGIALGLVGLLVLFGPGAFPAGSRPPMARIAALFLASAVWCLGSVYSKHAPAKVEPTLGASMQMLAGGAAAVAAALASGEGALWHPGAIAATSWLAFAYLVAIGSLVAYPTYVWLLKHETPARVSSYAYVNPLIAVVAGWAILHESIPVRCLFAVPLLLAGIAMITLTAGAGEPANAERSFWSFRWFKAPADLVRR